ncbi:E3 ubiquitin-protein ligase PPP1R11-like [Portunus trituberculatus]|uniref:E3 ubiquitin-protein ligase PPP1R11-like n=1 Tax=Portunus trituberculatus TaxID=210409 RepID=UPI001E1CFDC9|nr:E3 ubiquitin-protein ligase PPP1R11-like [Portunus trituberculatus]
MATSLPSAPSGSATTVVEPEVMTLGPEEQVSSGVVRLKLHKPRTKKVSWTNDTVDNEHLGKKKSKCCCVYVKPHEIDMSSSETDDDECEHCLGHVEKKKKKKKSGQSLPNSQGESEGTDRPYTRVVPRVPALPCLP